MVAGRTSTRMPFARRITATRLAMSTVTSTSLTPATEVPNWNRRLGNSSGASSVFQCPAWIATWRGPGTIAGGRSCTAPGMTTAPVLGTWARIGDGSPAIGASTQKIAVAAFAAPVPGVATRADRSMAVVPAPQAAATNTATSDSAVRARSITVSIGVGGQTVRNARVVYDVVTNVADRTPALYLGHGAPPLVDDPAWPRQLAQWATDLPRPTAILVVSAHWEESPLTIGATTPVPLVYDFYGFPQKYYQVTYPQPGAPRLAEGG